MIKIKDIDISVISELLTYFVPGYLALFVFENVCALKMKRHNSLVISCVISYIAVALAELVMPLRIEDIFAAKAIFACAISLLGAVIFACAVRNKYIDRLLGKWLHFSPSPTVLSGAISLKGGTTARVYIKNLDYYVEGAVAGYSNDSEDPFMALCYYSYYKHNSAEPFYVSDDCEKQFIFRLSDVQHIEFWQTRPADVYQEDSQKHKRKAKDISPFGLRKYGSSVITHKPQGVSLFAERKYGVMDANKRSGVVAHAFFVKKNSAKD